MVLNFLVFVFGLVFGSFFNVLIYRIPKKESISFPPSHCLNCNYKIAWYDNIPLLSYIILKGKCRECKTPISIQYPLIEFTAGLIFVLIFILMGLTASWFIYTVTFSILLVLSIIDLKTKEINVAALLFPAVLIVIFYLIYNFNLINSDYLGIPIVNMKSGFIGFIAGGLFVFLIRLVGGIIMKQEAMGEADIYIASLMGLILGYRAFFYAVALAGLYGLLAYFLIPFFKKDKEIPFIPFLSLATFTVFLIFQILAKAKMV